MLIPNRCYFAVIEQCHAVIELTIFPEYAAHQHSGAAVAGCQCQSVQLRNRQIAKRGLAHQILGGIADQLLFGKNDQVNVPCPRPPFKHRIGIAGKIADALIYLGHGDSELICHIGFLLFHSFSGKVIVSLRYHG